jgi:transmembrane sensor
MAKVHRIPDRSEAEREASDWIARLNADDVSVEDRARFEIWRRAHPQHERAYESLSATWRELVESGPLVRAVAFGQAMNAATSPSVSRRPWGLAAVAVSLATLGLVAAGYWLQFKSETLFQTAVGEHASVSLPDGSSIDLNSNSLAKVAYTAHARVIHLERGEAFFKVAHDMRRPFWVVAGHSWVRAVGTAFNVYLRSEDVEVTVSEGIVKVVAQRAARETPSDSALGQALVSVLIAGEQADVDGPAAVVRALEPEQLTHSVAWRQGMLYFENQPLGDVVNEISRYTTLKIEISDASLSRLPVGGTFRANPDGAEALLSMLQDGLGLTVRRDGQERAFIEGKPGQ